jgi:hypothetical protein
MCQGRPGAHHVPAVDERQLRQLRSSGLGRRTSAGCRAARPATSRPARAGRGVPPSRSPNRDDAQCRRRRQNRRETAGQ